MKNNIVKIIKNEIFEDTEVEGEFVTLENTAEDMNMQIGIEGNSTQEMRSGKNKFNINSTIALTISNQTFTATNLWARAVMTGKNIAKDLKVNTKYKAIASAKLISKPTTLGTQNIHSFIMCMYNPNTQLIIPILNLNSREEKNNWEVGTTKDIECTFTTPETDLENNEIRFYGFYGNNDGSTTYTALSEFEVSNMMIIEDTETDTTYELYGAQPSFEFPSEIETVKENVEVVACNKNFIDTTILESKKTSAILDITEDSFTIDLSKGGLAGLSNANILFANLNQNLQYTLSYHMKQDNLKFLPYLKFIYSDGSVSGTVNSKYEQDTVSISSKDKKIVGIALGWNTQSAGGRAEFTNIQLEIGNIATEHSKPQKQEATIQLQQEMLENDYFDFKNNKEIHNWEKIILTGEENISKSADTVADRYLVDTGVTGVQEALKSENIKCNVAVYGGSSKNTVFGDLNGVNNALRLSFQYSDYGTTTVEEFKAKLKEMYDSGNPIVVYVRYAKIQELEFTEEQKAKKEKIRNMMSYEDITNVYTDNIAKVKVETKLSKIKKLEKMLGGTANE